MTLSYVDPGTGDAAQDVHITPGYRLWKPTFSHPTTDWTQRGDTPKIDDDGGSLWKWLCCSWGQAMMMMMNGICS